MEIEADSPTQAGEAEVDFSIVQLVETSEEFRQWFVTQAAPHLEIDDYIGGIIHSNYAGEGESDIEFGFRTATGERHLVLIENKIDASLQPNQVERYFNRGQFRVDGGDWDSFTVCLLAPERYISPDNRADFDSVIRYEAVLEILDDLTHDSAEFFQAVIESTEEKSVTTDASNVLRTVADHFRSETEIPEFYQSVSYKKRVGFRSDHPQHPDAVQYDVYIADAGEDGRTEIRLQIADTEELSKEERERIKSVVSQNLGSLSRYDAKLHRTKSIAVTDILHDEAEQNSTHESYPVAIAEELLTLAETFHPLFAESPTS
ncbi:hypothetical protein HALDL1_04285 [Halobacterium sp. DL1]|jgi:hypothetical protein|nr:hypothetical protein HALDL1_04285 [Halobacterium sp. DL1]